MAEQEIDDSGPESQPPPAEANGGGERGVRSGTKYPYYDLEAAERFAKSVQEAGGNEVLEEELLKHLRLSQTTKSWIYSLSTGREFGLIERKGQKADARSIITELGKRLLVPGDDAELLASRAAAFLTPQVYRRLFERYKDAPVPQPQFLANILVREHKLVDSVSQPAAEAFIASARFAGLVNGNNILSDKRVPQRAEEKPETKRADVAPGTVVTKDTMIVPAGFIKYNYKLRKDLTIEVPLPDDLTKKDVARLKKWMDTLIVDDDDEEAEEK